MESENLIADITWQVLELDVAKELFVAAVKTGIENGRSIEGIDDRTVADLCFKLAQRFVETGRPYFAKKPQS